MVDLSLNIHALLFAEGGALTYRSLARSLDVSEEEIAGSLDTLAQRLENTGIGLVRSDTEVSLAIIPEARAIIEKNIREDESRNIGEAGLEILAILLYEGPATRAQIDYVRGVNSSSTIRTLLTRGLIERTGNPEDGREYLYRATTDLLAHLGVSNKESLPEYGTISTELSTFKAGQSEHGAAGTAESRSATGDA